MSVTVLPGDCLELIRTLADNSVDACVTDPPYALVSITKRWSGDGPPPREGVYRRSTQGFMGKKWDTGDVAHSAEFWREVYRVLKPGAHLLAFSGTRTHHRLACAIEDAGFEIRDTVMWCYGSGFPKSHDVSKGIDRAAGAEREVLAFAGSDGVIRKPRAMSPGGDERQAVQTITAPATDAAIRWAGWGTALKPAWEPICMARKPIEGTVAANVLKHGTGAINVDGCRVEADWANDPSKRGLGYGFTKKGDNTDGMFAPGPRTEYDITKGRWPANLILSWPEDEYQLRRDITKEQRRELYGWLHENA